MPHRITNYIYDLASTFHSFYNAEKVLDADNLERTKARLALIQATQITLRNALALIGVSAPEKCNKSKEESENRRFPLLISFLQHLQGFRFLAL